MLSLMEGSEPFFRQGGSVGCLLIHGFTGTAYEMRGLGEWLADRGYTVFGPRLAHHGTTAADLNRSRWWDWYYSALDGWHLLQASCEKVFVIGLSMGGMTTLMLAANQPVAGIVIMSTPVAFIQKAWTLKLARFLWPFLPLVRKQPEDYENETWPSYPEHPVRALGEVYRYLKVVDAALPAVKAPALVLHCVDDQSVPLDNQDYIYKKIGSTIKKKVCFQEGGHVMTEGKSKEEVYQQVIDFLIETAA